MQSRMALTGCRRPSEKTFELPEHHNSNPRWGTRGGVDRSSGAERSDSALRESVHRAILLL